MMTAVRRNGAALQLWRSGASSSSTASYTHRNVFKVLSMTHAYDQLEMCNVAAGEYLCRRALMMEAACRRNPK
eukprot:2313821-Alexandrium_andersonii.AAC.1